MKKSFSILRFMCFAIIALVATAFCVDCISGIVADSSAAQHSLVDPGVGAALLMGNIVVAPFPVDEKYTGISNMYRNASLIADRVLRRIPVGKQLFKYRQYAKGTFLTLPETLVGRTGRPNRVEIGYTEQPDSTFDYGLDDPVPVADIENAPDNYDPLGTATEFLTDLIALDREKRVADLVFSTAQYGTNNKITLSGTSQFSNAASTPIDVIEDGKDKCFQRPNKCVMGRDVASKLFRHEDIVMAINGTSGNKGVVQRDKFAEHFEFDEVLIGEGWVNIAKPGQTPNIVRVWGKSMLMFHDNPAAGPYGAPSFGWTAQFGRRIAGPIEDKDSGLRGGVRMRVGESVKELVVASDMAYLIDAAVA